MLGGATDADSAAGFGDGGEGGFGVIAVAAEVAENDFLEAGLDEFGEEFGGLGV